MLAVMPATRMLLLQLMQPFWQIVIHFLQGYDHAAPA